MMLMTIFHSLDADGSGELTRMEFINGVMEMKEPPGAGSTSRGGFHREPGFSDKNELANAIASQEIAKKERQHMELLELEVSGAGRVLRTIVDWTKERGLTITMLMNELDKNGDGEISYKEMIQGIKRFMEPSTRVKAAQRKRA